MSDPREPGDARRSRSLADQPGARPGRPAKGDAIRAVSDLLGRKKPAFGGPPASAPFPLFPRSLDATLADLKKSPGLRAKFDRPGTSLGPPPVPLPGGGPPVRAVGDEPPPAEPPRAPEPGAASRAADPLPAGGSDGVRPAPVAARSVGDGPQAVASTASQGSPGIRLAPPSTILRDALGSPGPPGDPAGPAHPDAGRAVDRVSNPDPPRPGGAAQVVGPPGVAGTARVGAVDLPRDPRPASSVVDGPIAGGSSARPGAPAAETGSASGANALPAARGGAGSIAVRNPFASGLRNLSPADPGFPGAGGASSGLDATGIGSGPGEHAFGGANSPGGASADLSKTNDLLRQLIDAVRRQRDASLPVGGPSVYPDR